MREIAKASGVDKATLYRVERGAEPSLPTALKLALFYETTVEELWSYLVK